MKKFYFDDKLIELVGKCQDEIVKLLNKSGHTGTEGIDLLQDGSPMKFHVEEDGSVDYRKVVRVRINPDANNLFEYRLKGIDAWFDDIFEEYPADVFGMYECLVDTLEEEAALKSIKIKAIKTKLMKLLPNHVEVGFSNHNSVKIGNVTYLLWFIRRDGKTIWVDVEDDSPFGISMRGRYLINFIDLEPSLCSYILENLLSNNKKQ